MDNNDLEIKLLKETISALREELEKVHFEERHHIQQAVAEASAEIRHLRTSVVELRDQIELKEAEYNAKLQGVTVQHDQEKVELHRTIALLREKLEKRNESNKKTPSPTEAAARTSR